MRPLDQADMRILAALEVHGALSNVELARRANLSESACLRRTRALENDGVITGYRAVINPAALGRTVTAFVLVNLDQRAETDQRDFLALVREDSRVRFCAAITGTHDLILNVEVRDIQELGEITMDSFLKLNSVRDVTTCLVLRSYK